MSNRTTRRATAALNRWERQSHDGVHREWKRIPDDELPMVYSEVCMAQTYYKAGHYDRIVRRTEIELADAVVPGWDK